MMPMMFGGGILFQIVFRNNNDIRDRRVAVVDYTGQVFDGINQASNIRNQTLIYDGEGAARKQIQPRYIIEKADPGTCAYRKHGIFDLLAVATITRGEQMLTAALSFQPLERLPRL